MSNTQSLDLDRFLSYAAALIRIYGYVSTRDAQEKGIDSTADLAWEWATNGRTSDVLSMVSMTIQDRETAKETAAWMQNQYTSSGYSSQIREIFRAQKVFLKDTGYATSAVVSRNSQSIDAAIAADTPEQTAQKIDDLIETLETKPATATATATTAHQNVTPTPAAAEKGKHLGVVGQKYSCHATLFRIHEFEGSYGKGYFYNFTDLDGNILVWSTNKTKETLGIDTGSVVYLTGTIKKHSGYKGIKQTEITRCSVTLP